MNIPFFSNKKDDKTENKKEPLTIERDVANPVETIETHETKQEEDAQPKPQKNHYYIADFYRNAALYLMLSDFLEHIPEWFYEDVEFSAAYGSFPNCIWNGGRTLLGDINKTRMIKTVEEFNKRGIAVRYTFTNPLIEKRHLDDIFANICMEVANNGLNEVLVNSPVLEEYIREKYPNFKLISSTTKCLMSLDQINAELDKDYYLVVLDSSLNNKEEIFTIPKRDRLEVLVDHGCRVDCPNRQAHYIASAQAQLNYDVCQFLHCPHVERTFEQLKQNGSFITREMITGKYNEAGFRHFKLDGRSFGNEKLLDSLMYYFVKPEYQDKMRGIIQKEIYDRFKEM